MIPRTADWKNALAQALRDPAELIALLGLPTALLAPARAAAQAFPLRVPRGFVARMRKGDPDDPLLRQVLPLEAELAPAPGFTLDPVGDLAASTRPGLLQKYAGRALLITTGACAVHCRYCFRRHFPYGAETSGSGAWRDALDTLAAQSDVNEVILSGGDPLNLDDPRLADLVARLEEIPQIRRLRIHSRLPVVLPERVDDSLIGWLAGGRLKPVMVIHANHAHEFDQSVAAALRRLRDAGVGLFNQTVLLRGVNDSVEALCDLSEALYDHDVVPYYLHALDRVEGAAHFDVEEPVMRALFEQVRQRLPGYLVPKLVREEAGAPYKSPL